MAARGHANLGRAAEEPVQARKYRNQPTEVDGKRFDSLAEARRFRELVLLERAGEIATLMVHPRFELLPGFRLPDGKWESAVHYTADFSYQDRSAGRCVVEDVKGGPATQTTAFRLRRKLFLYKFARLYDLRVVQP